MNRSTFTWLFLGVMGSVILIGSLIDKLTSSPPGTGTSSTTAGATVSPQLPTFWDKVLAIPMPILIFAGVMSVFFLAIMLFGFRRHWKVEGNGAMHAVTIVAVFAFITVFGGTLYYVGTEYIFDQDAAAVRENLRKSLKDNLDPRGQTTTSTPINWSDMLLPALIIISLVWAFWPEKKKEK